MEEVVRLVSSGDCVKIWDSVFMATCEQFSPHCTTHPVSQVCWSSNNQYLVSASSIGDRLVVSSLKSSPVAVIELAEGKKQTRVSLSGSSQYLLSGGLDHTVNIWDLKSRKLHRSMKDHKEEVTCVSFNANDSFIASGSTSGELILHSLTTNMSSKAFGHGASQPIRDLRFSSLKRSLLGSVSDSGTVVLWDSNSQKELNVFEGAHKAPGSGLAFSPASDLLFVSVGLDKKIICYDTASKIILRVIRVDAPLTAIDFTPDGTGVVVGSTQGKIYHYDLRNSTAPTRVTAAHKTSVTCLRFQSQASGKQLKSTRAPSSKRILTKLPSGLSDASLRHGPAHPVTTPQAVDRKEGLLQSTGGAYVETPREGEGHLGSERLPALEKFSSVGRSSLDMFSPAREDTRSPGMSGETPVAKANATGGEMLLRDGELQQVRGRPSLDVFSPLRDDSNSSGLPHRKTPLGTLGNHCFSPIFQTPPPIKEEETLSSAVQPTHSDGSSPEADRQTTSTTPLLTKHKQPAPPEPQDPLGSGYPLNALPLPTIADSGLSVSSQLSQSAVSQLEGVCSQGGAPLTSLQIHFIQNMIHETLEDFRDACHRDIVNLQVEMVRQFYIQLNEIHGLIEKYSLNDALVDEIQKLREENRKLKANY